jgi:hypothetical protein
MLRFFRTRAPVFGLLLLVALLVTLPGIRHPLPMVALVIFTALAWRALSRWRARVTEDVPLEEQIAKSASAWDARHQPPDELDKPDDDEPWRASLGPPEAWRATRYDDDPI